jgi:hypothetical protein
MASIVHILQQLEATEANVERLLVLFTELCALVPEHISFARDVDYEDTLREFVDIQNALPSIDGWKPTSRPLDLDRIATTRKMEMEIDEPDILINLEQEMQEPGREISEYRFRLRKKRRELLRAVASERIASIDRVLDELRPILVKQGEELAKPVAPERWHELVEAFSDLATLLGADARKVTGWSLLQRHLRFGQYVDLADILATDWPTVRPALERAHLGKNDPMPVEIGDISELAADKPSGPIPTHLNWHVLDESQFERLLFSLLVDDAAYQNPQWLTQTNAPDRGRDLSAFRVIRDGLAGNLSQRVIVQCKHWQKRSVSPIDVALLKEQIQHWQPPRVDILIIATSGHFTADAVDLIEKHNLGDHAMRIEMWPSSHLEMLLAARPAMIGEFGLRNR